MANVLTPRGRIRLFAFKLGMRFTFLLICICANLTAQTMASDSVAIRKQITALTNLWLAYQPYSQKITQYDSLSTGLRLYPAVNAKTDTANNPQLDLIELEKQQLQVDKGLRINGSYAENFTTGAGDENLFYRRRAQAGLEWNVMSGGYFANQNSIQQLDNQAAITSLKLTEKTSSVQELKTYNTIIYIFNHEKTGLIAQRSKIMNEKLEIVSRLYAIQAIPYLTYLETQKQQADILAMYNLYAAYNNEMNGLIADSLLPNYALCAFDIDADKLFKYAGTTNISDSINKLVLENIRLENAPVNNIEFNLYLRYNYYDYGVFAPVQNRNFLSAGASVSAPIYFGRRPQQQVVATQEKILQYSQTEASNTRNLTLANALYEFRYKLKQFENFHSKRRTYVELLRIELIKQQFGDLEFNPLTALTLLDELLQIDIEMADLRQQLYLILLDIHHELPAVSAIDYTKSWNPLALPVARQTFDQHIYIWSSSQQEYSASFITNYLIQQSVRTAIISPGKTNESYKRTAVLMDSLQRVHIETQLMLGENSLLKRKNISTYLDSVYTKLGATTFEYLHLDVEPHTFSDWDTRKQEYLDQYLVMINEVQKWCSKNQKKLAVSIPVFYPTDFLSKLYPLTDKVYLMAYEQKDASKVAEKTKEERAIDADKTIIAIRTKEFTDKQSMNDFLLLLSDKTTQNVFAIHDFNSLVKLPQSTK
jgi:hypothetical protein